MPEQHNDFRTQCIKGIGTDETFSPLPLQSVPNCGFFCDLPAGYICEEDRPLFSAARDAVSSARRMLAWRITRQRSMLGVANEKRTRARFDKTMWLCKIMSCVTQMAPHV